jgi:signal peptidase II
MLTRKKYFFLAFLIAIFDQVSKNLVTKNWALGEGESITSFFNLIRVHNTGAAFSLLSQAGGWQRFFFLILTLIATFILIAGIKQKKQSAFYRCSLALILGGAWGNGWDRLMQGYVVDFLQFHWAFLDPLFAGGYFPCFNLADIAITGGVIGIMIIEIFGLRPSSPPSTS